MPFRPDIEGLRAVAVGAVLLAHAGLGFAAGGFVGVDVFYVISGYLITGLLVREVELSGTVSLTRFYGRRAKRLLPAAALVVVAVLAASALFLSPARTDVIAGDAVASSLYFVNWHFVAESADYFGAATDQSPLQHYWSLAVEEQFYLVWPLLILAITVPLKRRGASAKTMLTIVVALISAASLAFSVSISAASAGEAYFSTFTRVWELGLGALLALLPAAKLARPAAGVVATLGVGAIAAATLAYDSSTSFPGYAALLPCLGAAAVIVAGSAANPYRPLTFTPVRYVGRISYCLYLWHWPALAIVATKSGVPSTAESAALVLAAFVPAILTHHFVERPILHAQAFSRKPRRSLLVGAGCTVAGLAAAGAVVAAQPEYETADARDVAGARAALNGKPLQERAVAVRPNPLEAGADKGRLADDGCLAERDALTSKECAYGPHDASRKVVLLGDSHAVQYFPALERLAEDHEWQLTGLTKAGCTPADVLVFNPALQDAYPECEEWRDHALERIEEIEGLDMVIVSTATFYNVVEGGSKISDSASNERLEDGYAATLERLSATGAKVVVMADLPHAPIDVSDCVSENLDSLSECTFPTTDAKNQDPFDVPAAERVPGVDVVDITPLLCPDDVCRAVIGDAITYRGSNHMTATYAASLDPFIRDELPEID